MAYADITLTEAEDLLARLLADPDKIRFVSDELQTRIIEAVRTWSALSGIYDATSNPIAIAAGSVFVDLPALGADPGIPYTLLESDLLGPIEYALIEPKQIVAWSGSEMFTLAELQEAIRRRRDQFLLETRCRVDRVQLPATPLPSGSASYALPDTTVAVMRVAWAESAGGKVTPVWRSNHWSVRTSRPGLQQTVGLPRVYDFHSYAPPSLAPSPVPSDNGTFDLLLVRSGAIVTGGLTYLGIPDDFAWAIQWGALADLLSKDGPSRDYARSLYCERRYRLGVAAMLERQTITDVTINGQPMKFTTIGALDSGRLYWQNRSAAIPLYAAPVGANMIVLADPPSSACNLVVRILRNAPVPTLGYGAEFVQVGREFLDMILGYAVHLSMFKIGGTEFAATTHLANAMFDAAAEFNARLRESSAFEEVRFSDHQSGPSRRGIQRVTGASVGGAQQQEEGTG